MESTVFKNLNIFNEEYPKFRKKFSSLIQQVNKLKIIIFVLIQSVPQKKDESIAPLFIGGF
jgi:archaellum component FlaC